MARKPSVKRQMNAGAAGAAALAARGLQTRAIDLILPDCTIRYHLSPPANDDNDLDRELADLEAKLNSKRGL
jgi:hypothetical protein